MISRRTFLSVLFASLATPAVAAEREPHEVKWADRDKVQPKFRPRMVEYDTKEAAGTIVIDTPNKYLYLVLGGGKARRYGVGVGKDGFRWSGTATVARMSKWPKWTPTKEQLQRNPHWKQWAKGYPGGKFNPLGARALYLFENGVDTQYRIHGTTEPETIGRRVSSGCLRMLNVDVIDLYDRVKTGAKVVVL